MPSLGLALFDSFLDWYRERVAPEQDFSYEVADLLSGAQHAAAVLTPRSGSSKWRQVALYEIRDGRIKSIWAAEDPVIAPSVDPREVRTGREPHRFTILYRSHR